MFNILLQILDDGRLTDSQGRTVDFRNTVIIMTSNIGSHFILEHAGGDWAIVETQVNQSVRSHFKPEFLNRVERKITMEITPEAKRLLAEEGYDPAFGARPLKRTIQRLIQNPLALALLEGRFHDGDHIVVTVGPSGTLQFETAEAGAATPAGVA